VIGTYDKVFLAKNDFYGLEIKKIEFKGLENISDSDAFQYLTIREGDPFSIISIRNSIKELFRSGYFRDIKVEAYNYEDGVKIVFSVVEKPMVSEVEIRGMEEYYEDEVKEKLPIKEDDVFSEYKLKEAVNYIYKKYYDDGYFWVDVRYKVERDIKKNKVKVIFYIDENERINIQRIVIEGAKNVSPDDIVDVMDISSESWSEEGKFNYDKLEESKQKILDLYGENGFLNAKILDVKLKYVWLNTEDRGKLGSGKRGLIIDIVIDEGERYFFGGYDFKGNYRLFKKKDFLKAMEQKEIGDIFNYKKYMMDRQRISIMYANKGYIFARIIPEFKDYYKEIKGEKKKFRKVIFTIEDEGNPVYINAIYIKGNEKTKEKVIRRELLIKPGDKYDFYKVQRSRERLFNLGFFKKVDIKIRPYTRDKVNLVVEVEEQPTGNIALGGGYGTLSGFSIFAELAENNLMGNGQRISTRIEYGPNRRYFSLGFREPWLFETTPISLSISAYITQRKIITSPVFPTAENIDNPVYYELIRGFSITLGYRFWINWGVWNTISPRWSEVYGVSGAAPDSVFALQDRGVQFRLKDTIGIYYDIRDNVFNPTRGYIAKFYVDLVGGLLFMIGDDHYIRYNFSIYYYKTLFRLGRNYPFVLELRWSGSFTDAELNFLPELHKKQDPEENPYIEDYDKLRLGGVETLRGWDYSDINFPPEWRIGENHRILYGIELRFPIVSPMLWWVFFIDAGCLWNEFKEVTLFSEDYRFSYGFGLKIQIPMMPIRFYFGRRVEFIDHKLTAIGGFNFSFGIGDMRF
jgi:outer membrane protein insertion porin family